MADKLIKNPRMPDGNLTRTQRPVYEVPKSMELDMFPQYLPHGFVQTTEELDILKWALQFYIYQEKNQKISGKIYLSEITPEKREAAVRLLQRLV